MELNTDTMATQTTPTMKAMTSVMSTSLMTQTTVQTVNEEDRKYNLILLAIYSVVLVVGTISLSLMIHIMKSGSISTTSIAVLNLIFAHSLFLATLPFRIFYYSTNEWTLGLPLCKVVSSMIHIHMYMSFIFYVIILITRQLIFYQKANLLVSPSRIHAFAVSAFSWSLVFIIITCIIYFRYGESSENGGTSENARNSTGNSNDSKRCFHFGKNIDSKIKVLNYFLSALIIVVTLALTVLQANVLRVLYRKHHNGCTSQQEFGAQFKSFCFALIMFACFIPYHIFRLYYLEHLELQNLNEVLLSLTTFNCLDMLTFLGRRTCSICYLGRSIWSG